MIFKDIETYIEFIAGYRDATGTHVKFWPDIKIQIASYDVGFVTSVAEQTISKGIAMSHKQGALAERLIKTYAKQLRKVNVEQPNHSNYRMPLREIVYVTSLTMLGTLLFFRFPFNNNMISDIRNFAKDSQGAVSWSKDDKAWTFALTEYNISWAVCYAQTHNIPVSPDVVALFDLILEAEKTPYAIELQYDNGKCFINNAPDSLNEYVAEHIGFDDIYKLVDMAGVLGYTISEEITSIIKSQHDETFVNLCLNKSIDCTPNSKDEIKLEAVIEWAIEVNRLPIIVYNQNFLTPDLTILSKYFKDDEITVYGMTDTVGLVTGLVDQSIKVVYTNKVLDNWAGQIPLLITYTNLMQGMSKRRFQDKSEKIVYYCAPLPRR
jgi:hypothetical protein